VTNVGAVGVTGYLSGPSVYVFDDYSLANPIGSHFVVAHHSRPGHQKFIGPDWMIGRFGTDATVVPSGVSEQSVTAARRALACGPLNSYLHAISVPLSFSQAISNITHSLSFTTMTFSATPGVAARELCH
jgi:arabinofuranosyltransferase